MNRTNLMDFVGASVTAAGIVCTWPTPITNPGSAAVYSWGVFLDGVAVATAALSVSVQMFDVITGLFQTPTSIYVGGVTLANPVSVPNGTALFLPILAPCPALQINITTFGTSTGTFTGVIYGF